MNVPARVVLIVNPVSGSGSGRALLAQLVERLREAGRDCQMVLTTGAADIPRQVAAHSAADTLLALAGGDGTIHHALTALVGAPSPVLLIPLGTENLLARQLGLEPNVDRLWRVLESGRCAPLDLARLNGRLFATVLGAGFDAEVVGRLSRGRRGHITHLDYLWPFWQTFCEYRFPSVKVVADGALVCDEPALVFVGNIPRYAIGLRILREARWDDGLLDLCVFRCKDQGQLVEHAFWTWLNWHVEHRRVLYQRARTVQLESAVALPLQADGDPAGHLPAEVEVLPGAMQVLVPSPATTDAAQPSALSG